MISIYYAMYYKPFPKVVHSFAVFLEARTWFAAEVDDPFPGEIVQRIVL